MFLQYKLVLSNEQKLKSQHTLHEKCLYSEFSDPYFLYFDRIQRMQSISQYSFRMRENMDQKNYEYRHFSRSDTKHNGHKNARTNGSFETLLGRFS